MEIIYGTTNESKTGHMRSALSVINGLVILGLNDVLRDAEQMSELQLSETGTTIADNARIKAAHYYNVLKRPVFASDSGLYVKSTSKLEVKVRRIDGKRLTDDEMIEYYSGLARSNSDEPLIAQFRNAICLVMGEDRIYECSDDSLATHEFIIADKPHSKRLPGFPLDSLSIHIPTGKYYFDLGDFMYFENTGYISFFNDCLVKEGII